MDPLLGLGIFLAKVPKSNSFSFTEDWIITVKFCIFCGGSRQYEMFTVVLNEVAMCLALLKDSPSLGLFFPRVQSRLASDLEFSYFSQDINMIIHNHITVN